MMNSTENIFIIFLLNFQENGTENTLCHPHVRIMADKQYLQTYFAVKDNYITLAISSCTNIQGY